MLPAPILFDAEGSRLHRSRAPGTDPSRAILLYKQTNLREIAASLSMLIHSMAWRFLSGAQMNEVIAKRLALNMALMCVRNTCIEDVHAGVEPSSKAGDFSDAKLVTPYGEIRRCERVQLKRQQETHASRTQAGRLRSAKRSCGQ